jgi:hypothetical protein
MNTPVEGGASSPVPASLDALQPARSTDSNQGLLFRHAENCLPIDVTSTGPGNRLLCTRDLLYSVYIRAHFLDKTCVL